MKVQPKAILAGVLSALALHAGQPQSHQQDPFLDRTAKAVVLLFTRSDCPISNRYAPEVRRIYDRYASRNLRFFLVYPDRDETLDSIARHRAEYSYPFGFIRDPRHELVDKAHVSVTPEAAVFVPRPAQQAWQLVYHGRIDDRVADFGKSRPEPSRRDLQDVLDAVLEGKPVPRAETKAIGCFISDLR
jgi:hypothetical protein